MKNFTFEFNSEGTFKEIFSFKGFFSRDSLLGIHSDSQYIWVSCLTLLILLSSNICFSYIIRFLRYLMQTLDAYVDMDYSLVYFHHGLTSKNKPPLRWLWDVYKALDRRYKKNVKSLFLVHPTNFIRVVWNFFKPIIR